MREQRDGQTRNSGSLDALDVLARCPGALLAARQHGRTRAPQPDRDGASRATLAQNEHVNSNQETGDGTPAALRLCERSRAEIIAIARHFLAKASLADCTLDDVADTLGATRIYHCFPNRGLPKAEHGGVLLKGARDADDGPVALQALTTAFIDRYRDRLAFFRLDSA